MKTITFYNNYIKKIYKIRFITDYVFFTLINLSTNQKNSSPDKYKFVKR